MPTTRRDFLTTAATASLAAATSATAVASGSQATDPKTSDLKSIGRTPHTRFAVNVEMWWTALPFLDRIRKTAELGFPAIEFWPLDNKDLAAVADLTEELGLEIAQFTAWGFTPGLNELKNHDDFVRTIDASIAGAKQLRCKKATVVAGNDVPGMSPAPMHANVVTALKRVAKTVEDADLMLILEPMNIRVDHKGHCLYGSAPAMAICAAVGSSHVKINWDLYHMQITEGDLCGHLAEGMKSGHIGYLQLADHPGRHEPGTGEIHYNRVLKAAHDLGYRDYVGLECRPTEEVAAARRVAAADQW